MSSSFDMRCCLGSRRSKRSRSKNAELGGVLGDVRVRFQPCALWSERV